MRADNCWGVSLALVLLCPGCGGEAPTTTETPAAAVQSDSGPQPSANDDASEASPTLDGALAIPDAPPMSATEQEAREALRTLTTTGVTAEKWEGAHQKLVDLGADAAQVLKEALQGDDLLARDCAASILALSPEAALQARTELSACLDQPSNYLRANAAAALALIPGEEQRVVSVLLELLGSSDAELKRMAAVNLRNLGPDLGDRVAELRPLLMESDSEVLLPVLEMLAELGPKAKPLQADLERLAQAASDPAVQAATRKALEQAESAAESTEASPTSGPAE